MQALFVDGKAELIGTPKEVSERVLSIKQNHPEADIEKVAPVPCGACGAPHFDWRDAACCGCHDYY